MVAGLVMILFKQALRQRLHEKKKNTRREIFGFFRPVRIFIPQFRVRLFLQVRAPDFSVLFQLGFGHNRRRSLRSKKVL